MYKKLLLVLGTTLLISPTAYGRVSTRCVREVYDCKKAVDTKRVMDPWKDIKMVHEALDILEYQSKKATTNRQALAINLRLILMLTEFANAIPFFGEFIKQVPGLRGSNYMNGFPWGLKPGDLIFLTEQNIPETYAIAKRHANSMSLNMAPTILLSRAKDIETSPGANLLQACGCILLPEATLKSRMNDSELEGMIVHQLAGIKKSYKAAGFTAMFLQSNLTRVISNVAVAFTMYKVFKKGPGSNKGLNGYADNAKNWLDQRNFFTKYLIKLTPNAMFNYVWARALRHMEKDTDGAAAYSTKATNALIDYIKFEQGRENFNMELWATGKERLADSELSNFIKYPIKAASYLYFLNFRVGGYLFSTGADKDERISSLETKLKRYQLIEDTE